MSQDQQLINAVIRGDASTVQSLLEQGVDANSTGGVTPVGESNTALMWAAGEGYLDIVQQLLEHGAEVNNQEPRRKRTGYESRFAPESQIQIAIPKASPQSGGEYIPYSIQNAANFTAIMYAAERGYAEIIHALLDRKADIQVRNRYQETLLMSVARFGLTDIVLRLIDLGADPNAVNKIGDTALYLAVDNGQFYVVKALIDRGATVNTANLGGWTPLMMASARADLEIMELLLSQNADVTPRNRWGGSALSEAKQSFRSSQAVTLLRQAGAIE
jgi:ankyrin repeat protein